MTPLAESAAIILGAATWPKYKEFDPHQSFRNSAEFFRDYLLENGLTNLLWLFDEPDQPAILIEKIGGFLKEERNQALRNVIFYYVGHGGHFERQYFVAPACTSKAALDLSILPVRYLADTLYREAPAQRHIVIIDACYAAGAVKDFIRQSATDVVKQVREVLRELDRSRGTSLFCAAGSLTEAKAPWQADFTMFSGALRNALTKGDPEAGPLLSLRQLAELVEAEIFAAFRGEAVRPEVHTPRQDRGDISTVELFPNPAFLERDRDEAVAETEGGPGGFAADDAGTCRGTGMGAGKPQARLVRTARTAKGNRPIRRPGAAPPPRRHPRAGRRRDRFPAVRVPRDA